MQYMYYSPTYIFSLFLFVYRYKASITTTRDFLSIDPSVGSLDFGVSHGDDIMLAFRQSEELETKKTDQDYEMAKKMVHLWKQFIFETKPDPDWLPVDPNGPPSYAVLDEKV